ncbi:enoyl-ACP reductase II [Compostibacillus humi]|jgi:NAD(P)H-dependent flavin oxidoreductase YrpB (nitropropane dioxygenase family)|uniref:Probable nitronate monooxygenase n=1 Tax=Compostibacillus humi TaxID=1245525 RepID=A0A8J2ZR84_9BACI|nr:nitronate monooxygenase family protein [Compostibacillus humi]GGH72173.1 enoyl-ACP reductase II [Compostibacillus humi]
MKWNTRVTELLSIQYPIIQGGLAYLAYSELAAAVSNAGGLGQITAMSLKTPEDLRDEIHKVRKLTNNPFGVNFAIGQHGRPYEHMLEVAIEEKVPVISITGGNPKGILDKVRGTGIKTLVLVAAKRQAKKAESLGADAVMVVGQEGGGHLGRSDLGTFVLTPEVVDHVSIPVIASGGIVDGRSFLAALSLGAEGIEMGTRFIATKECVHAHPQYKKDILAADENSTVVIKRSIGAPARALKNAWTEKILKIEEENGGYEALKDYISGEANKRYIHHGEMDNGFGWAGQSAIRIHDIPTVEQLIHSILSEAEEIVSKWR